MITSNFIDKNSKIRHNQYKCHISQIEILLTDESGRKHIK